MDMILSINPLSVPTDGDTRYRTITGYAVMDGETVLGVFDTFDLASAAWDMIISAEQETPPHIPSPQIEIGEARPAL